MLNVYLASRYSTKDDIHAKAEELRAMGIGVTSRWLDEEHAPTIQLSDISDKALQEIAQVDLDDIAEADLAVLFTIDPTECSPRGGRHFESGFAYAMQLVFGAHNMALITVGPRENIFHHLPQVVNLPDWESAKQFLKEEYARRETLAKTFDGSGQANGLDGASTEQFYV